MLRTVFRRYLSRRVVWLPAFGQGLAFVVTLAIGVFVLPLPDGGGGGGSADAAAAAAAVEQTEFRTETSRTVRNGDGSYTTSLFEQPMNFRDSKGAWQPISSTIVAASGEAATDGYSFENKANRFKVAFKSEADADGLVRLEVFGDTYELGLEGAAAKQAQVGEDRVGYHDVFPATLLRYEVIGDGVKESLELADASAPTDYAFILQPPKGAETRAVKLKSGAWEVYQDGSPLPRSGARGTDGRRLGRPR